MTNKSENPREKLYRKMLHSHWVKIVSALASVVVFCTVYALILPAITMSNQDPKCGIEEHTHIAECYDAEGNIICGLEEHAHSLSCYSDLYAAIEDEGYWSADIPELTGDRNADVLAVAQSQIGYRENDENYLISENEQTKGYTRYGHWYGEFVDTESERLENGLSYYAYKDWDAMFASFVLNYADIYDMGLDSDAGNWAGALVDAGIYVDAADYVPQIGDLIFYTRNAGENMHVGIVSGVNRGFFGNEIKSISVIAGDSNNEVEEIKVAVAEYTEGDITFETIHGYGVLTPGYGVTDESTASEVQPDDSTVAEVAAEEIAGEDVADEPTVEEAADASEAEEVVNLDNSADHLIGQNEESLDTVEENVEGSALVEIVDGAVSEDGSEIVMNWSLSANLPDATLPAGAIIRVDTASAKVHSMTVDQVRAWAETAGTGAEYATFADNDNYEVTFIGDNGLLYSWADVQNMDAAAATSFTGIHIKAVNDVALGEDGAISFNFATTAKVADANVGQNYYVSKVNVNGFAGAATFTYENGEAEAVDQNEVLRDAGLEEEPAQKTLVSKKSDYTVTMSYGPEAEIPDGSKLYVKEIRKGTKEYDQYIEDAKAALGISEEDAQELLGRFFDIKIMTKDGEFEPKAPVNVNIEYKKPFEAEDASAVNAVHFSEDGTETIPVETVDVSESEEDMAMVKCVEFSAESFSIYGVVYTVDFEYTDPDTGEVYYYSLSGGKSINLTDLLVTLGVKNREDVEEFVANDVVHVEFSDPELVKVTQTGKLFGLYGTKDWIIESLKPFDTVETLEIHHKNGEIIEVKVTDDQTTGVWDLADTSNTQYLHISADQSIGNTELERNAAFKMNVVFSLNSSIVTQMDAYAGNPKLEYDLSTFCDTYPIENIRGGGTLTIGSRKVGTFRIRDNKVVMELYESLLNGATSFEGGFSMTFETDESRVSDDGEYDFTFPGTGDTVPINYKDSVEKGSKEYNLSKDNDGNYTLHYTANIQLNTDLNSLVFNDTLGGLQTLVPSTVKINGTSTSVSQSGNVFSFNVGNALGTSTVSKGAYTVTYDTIVTEAQLKQMQADKTTETNSVTWRVNGNRDVDGDHTEVEIEKPWEPIPVTKSISSHTNQPGDTVNYTITFGSNTTALSGFHISDSMTDVAIPQGKVTLNYNGQSVQIDFNGQATDSNYSKSMVPLFDYTFPEGTQGNGPVIATYSVNLIDAETAKQNGVYDTTEVNNTAIEHRRNTNDSEKTTVTYSKEPTYTVTKTETSNKNDDGKWNPGTEISYTLTIGDANTNMAGVNIKDVMTDLQILQGNIMIKVGNGNAMNLEDYVSNARKWQDDGYYSNNDVELFNFNMPSDAGNGPVIITYTTKVISQAQATASSVYGDQTIKNTGTGGKQSAGTEGIGEFEKFPITKKVTQDGEDVNHQTVEAGSVVHYTLTYGKSGINLRDAVIEDFMTDIQKLVGDITVRKSDGTSFTMPIGGSNGSEQGNNWIHVNDGKYNPANRILLFKYRLPQDIGEGPLTIEYDTQIISEDDAKESGIYGLQSAFNKFIEPETEVKIQFPEHVDHNPKVTKDFNEKWDALNNTLYWDITVERDENSAYPLENVTVAEAFGGNRVWIKNTDLGYWNYALENNNEHYFDVANAKVTTDDGTELSPGRDYTIDINKAEFKFPVLSERVHIEIPFHSPVKITNGYYMFNTVILNGSQTDSAEATYSTNKIDIIKNGAYTAADRILEWKVTINPSQKPFQDTVPPVVWFEDQIPDGLTLLNAETKQETDPSIKVEYQGDNQNGHTGEWINAFYKRVQVDEDNKIEKTDIHATSGGGIEHGLNYERVIVTYYTKLSEEEWKRITSSAAGSELFDNKVKVEAGDNQKFEATDSVKVTVDKFLQKTDTTTENEHGVVIAWDENAEAYVNSKLISYRVDINPYGYTLNSGSTLTLTDRIDTNMDLETGSVKVKTVTDEAVQGVEVSYNDDSRLLVLRNIPDETPLVLTYECAARSQGEDSFKNTATLIGGGSHSSSTDEKHNIQTTDAWVNVDGIFVSLHKIDENNITHNLQNAWFQLYEVQLEIGDLTDEQYDDAYWADLLNKVNAMRDHTASQADINYVKENFKIKEDGYIPVGGPVETTGADAYLQWQGLKENTLYAWVEVEAPENYTGYAPDDYHYFVGYQHLNFNTRPVERLPDDEQKKRKEAAWALDDAAQYANDITVASIANLTTWTATNVESKYTSIEATKEWEADSDNLFETRPSAGIKLQLWRINPDGSREAVGSPVAINADSNGNWPTYIWNKLLAEDRDGNKYKYTVEEEKVENYTTSYSDDGDGVTSGNITVTNKLIPKNTDIYVEKRFDENDNDLPDSISITLMKFRTDKSGTVTGPMETGYETVLTAENNWKDSFTGLPTREIEDEIPYDLTYTVVENTAILENNGYKYTVTYSDNGNGVLETSEDEPLIITNKRRTGSVKVSKIFEGIEMNQYPNNFKILATWTGLDGEISKELMISENQPENVVMTGSGTASDPYEWTISEIPVDTVVTFTETGYDVNGYDVTISGTSTSEEKTTAEAIADEEPGVAGFVNSYTPVTFDVTKIWRSSTDQNVEWVKDIELVLHKRATDLSEVTFTYSIKKDADSGNITATSADTAAPIPSISGNMNDGYTVHFDMLDSGYEYYATENNVDVTYQDPAYAYKDTDNIIHIKTGVSENFASDKEYIINRPKDAYELPSSGGPGTKLFTILGLALIVQAGVVLLIGRKLKGGSSLL